MKFDGKVALVTGSGRGIGREIALEFARRGANVVINYFRNPDPAEETAQLAREAGVEALVVRANVGDPQAIEQMFAEVERTFGGMDILVCNAASGYIRPVMEQKVKGWDWTMNINARSVLFCAQQAVPLMEKRGGGHIVNISSLGSFLTLPNYVVIGASKAAVETITRYLAVELAPKNITANAVSAGVVATDALKYFPNKEQMLEQGRARTPAGRLVTPQDIAQLTAFLCSDGATMIRGQTIIIDGGFSLLPPG
ncbi:MAG: enoyl-[acyl-carrier-protein] reductase FabL [Chloroflexi bacterium]|nr:enoyl-[acyl-carrier-protein] reductase FabL [Chloroflexota bacterium]